MKRVDDNVVARDLPRELDHRERIFGQMNLIVADRINAAEPDFTMLNECVLGQNPRPAGRDGGDFSGSHRLSPEHECGPRKVEAGLLRRNGNPHAVADMR